MSVELALVEMATSWLVFVGLDRRLLMHSGDPNIYQPKLLASARAKDLTFATTLVNALREEQVQCVRNGPYLAAFRFLDLQIFDATAVPVTPHMPLLHLVFPMGEYAWSSR